MIEKPEQIVPLVAGRANDVLLLRGRQQSYVFKWLHHSTTFGLNRTDEFELQRQLAQTGLAPEVIAYQPQQWVLQDYVDYPSVGDGLIGLEDKLKLTAKALARVHQQQPDWQGSSIWQKLERYVATAGHAEKQQLRRFREQLENSSSQVLCHFDLAFAHILLSDPLTIVDWEYAGWGDRITDIASTIEINNLTDSNADRLCYYYQLETGFQLEKNTLLVHREFVQWINWLWFRLLQQGTKDE